MGGALRGGVHRPGRARRRPEWEELDARFDAKYSGFRTARADMPASARAHYDGSRALLRLVPEGRGPDAESCSLAAATWSRRYLPHEAARFLAAHPTNLLDTPPRFIRGFPRWTKHARSPSG